MPRIRPPEECPSGTVPGDWGAWAKPVVISFDDGYRSDYNVAAPILQRLGWPGVLNLCVSHVKPHGDLPAPLVRVLTANHWELDAHSLTHPDLTTLGAAQLKIEVAGSRSWLRTHFHQPVDFFCYPSGAFDATVVAAVRAAGYKGATTTVEGIATPGNPYELSRVRVSGSMSVMELGAALRAAP